MNKYDCIWRLADNTYNNHENVSFVKELTVPQSHILFAIFANNISEAIKQAEEKYLNQIGEENLDWHIDGDDNQSAYTYYHKNKDRVNMFILQYQGNLKDILGMNEIIEEIKIN